MSLRALIVGMLCSEFAVLCGTAAVFLHRHLVFGDFRRAITKRSRIRAQSSLPPAARAESADTSSPAPVPAVPPLAGAGSAPSTPVANAPVHACDEQTVRPLELRRIAAQAEEPALMFQCPLCGSNSLVGCALDRVRFCISCDRAVAVTSRGTAMIVGVAAYQRVAKTFSLPSVGGLS